MSLGADNGQHYCSTAKVSKRQFCMNLYANGSQSMQKNINLPVIQSKALKSIMGMTNRLLGAPSIPVMPIGMLHRYHQTMLLGPN